MWRSAQLTWIARARLSIDHDGSELRQYSLSLTVTIPIHNETTCAKETEKDRQLDGFQDFKIQSRLRGDSRAIEESARNASRHTLRGV